MRGTNICPIRIAVAVGLLVVLGGFARPAGAYCIIRDTGSLELPAGSGLWCQDCCAGNPRVWQAADQPVPIAILNTTPADLMPDVRDAHDEWTNLEPATFSFSDGGTTTIDTRTNDGTNVVGFDPNYCTARGNCGEGVLASSGCSAEDGGTSDYRAVDCDIFYNAEEYSWGHDPGDYDPYQVCLHELGHDIGLVHPSDTPRRSGSRGCGPDSPGATMWWSIHGGSETLELDDLAGIASIYPTWRWFVHAVDAGGVPIAGATLTLTNTCFPHDGTDYHEGGQVYGAIDNCLIGEGTASDTYDEVTTYTTNADGNTPTMRLLDDYPCYTLERAGYDTVTSCAVLPSAGYYYTNVTMSDTDSRDMRAGDDVLAADDVFVGGDLAVGGTVYSSAMSSLAPSIGKDGSSGARVTPVATSTAAVIVHRGVGRLDSGVARVSLPPAVIDRMDRARPGAFSVRVTATADCDGLYVSEKGENYFVVSELEDGDSDATFNYEVAAPRALANNSVPR